MKSSQIASRLTGISTPIFGLSWAPPTSDVAVAEEVISFLEDRRVLFTAIEVEVPEHCVASVLEIRRCLTGLLGRGGVSKDLAASVRAMRAACRKFLDDLQIGGRYRGSRSGKPIRIHQIPMPGRSESETAHERANDSNAIPPAAWDGIADLHLNQALGELRGVIGIHVAQLAVRYGIDVEDGLAAILPLPDEE